MKVEPGKTELSELLSAYADEELSPEEEALVLEALEHDPEARLELEDQRLLSFAIRESLEMVGEEADLSGFADGVMAKIRSAPKEEAPLALGERLRSFASELFGRRRAPLVVGAAAFAAAALAISPQLMGGGGSDRMLLAGDPADAAVMAMTTTGSSGATIFKTTEGTTIIYLTSRE